MKAHLTNFKRLGSENGDWTYGEFSDWNYTIGKVMDQANDSAATYAQSAHRLYELVNEYVRLRREITRYSQLISDQYDARRTLRAAGELGLVEASYRAEEKLRDEVERMDSSSKEIVRDIVRAIETGE